MSECTCGMELGKKLSAIEHLLSSAPKLVGDGKSLTIDLRSSSPWSPSSAQGYIELVSTYGKDDKREIKVQVDTQAKEFRIDDYKGPISRLQSELEHRHLVHMIEDALVLARDKNLGALVERLNEMHAAASLTKPLPADRRERFRVRDLVRGAGEQLEHLADKIETSVERWFESLGGLTRSEVEARLDKCQALYDRGEHLAAREQLEEIIDVVPEHARVQHLYGWLLLTEFADSQLERAAKHLERAAKLDNKNASTRQCLGDVMFLRGDLVGARNHYEAALDLSSGGSLFALWGLGQVHELEGDFTRARSFFVRASRQAHTPEMRRLIDLSDARVARRIAAKAN